MQERDEPRWNVLATLALLSPACVAIWAGLIYLMIHLARGLK